MIYYLKIDIRYSVTTLIEDNEYDRNYYNKIIYSDSFETEKECIEYGNKLIENNLWMEQYPGTTGCRLTKRFGRPLVAFLLKNGTQIFISVETLNNLDFQNLNIEL